MSHLFFTIQPTSENFKRKTKIYSVTSRHDNSFLGEIRFSGRWRQFVYVPSGNEIMWSWECLEELKEMLIKLNNEWRNSLK